MPAQGLPGPSRTLDNDDENSMPDARAHSVMASVPSFGKYLVKLENAPIAGPMVVGQSRQVSIRPESQARLSPANTSKALQGLSESLTSAYPARASK